MRISSWLVGMLPSDKFLASDYYGVHVTGKSRDEHNGSALRVLGTSRGLMFTSYLIISSNVEKMID